MREKDQRCALCLVAPRAQRGPLAVSAGCSSEHATFLKKSPRHGQGGPYGQSPYTGGLYEAHFESWHAKNKSTHVKSEREFYCLIFIRRRITKTRGTNFHQLYTKFAANVLRYFLTLPTASHWFLYGWWCVGKLGVGFSNSCDLPFVGKLSSLPAEKRLTNICDTMTIELCSYTDYNDSKISNNSNNVCLKICDLSFQKYFGVWNKLMNGRSTFHNALKTI